MAINCVTRIHWAKYFVTLSNERFINVSKNNVFAARVEILQVSEVADDFATATPLACNNSTLAAIVTQR